MGQLSRGTVRQAKILFIEGANTTAVSQSLNISWTTARKLASRFQPLQCKCGKKSGHRGYCQSSLVAHYISEESEFSTSIDLLVESDGCTGKCIEAGCPFPAVKEYKCRQHVIDARQDFSFLPSTLAPLDLFIYPQRNRTVRRKGCK